MKTLSPAANMRMRMPTPCILLHLSLLISSSIHLICVVESSPDMFTAIVDVERALQDEQKSADLLRNYISHEKKRIEQLELLADRWQEHSATILSNLEGNVYHPVNFYLLAKYFAVSWPATINQYITTSAIEELKLRLKESTSNFPNQEAFVLSASGLLRLQDVYNLQIDVITSGTLGGLNSSAHMSADDCFQLGKVAYENDDFYHAVSWFTEALRIGEMELEKTSKALILDYLSYATYRQGNLRHAYNLTLEWLALEPQHERANHNVFHYRQEIDQEEERSRRERQVIVAEPEVKNERKLDQFRNTEEYAAYEALCRGEQAKILANVPARPELYCQYRRHIPMFYIRPLKEELVSLQPKIVLYHDAIADSEIEELKRHSIPKLHRSGVFGTKSSNDPTAPGFTNYRTSKSAWLHDVESSVIARISRRAAGMSNLTLDSVEDFQVLNYGIGGHYEPHYDFSRGDEIAQFRDDQGNRIATVIFYMNDVHYGGYTVFNMLGISVPTTKGNCLIFYNLLTNGEGDYRTRHAGCPVLVGTKWVANKWFHHGGQEFSRRCSLNPAAE